MRYKIVHTTTYTYSKPVILGMHIIRLTPKNAFHMMVHHFHLHVDPQPSYIYQIEETDGSSAFVAYFNKTADRLYFEHTSEVSVEPYNPYKFIINPDEFLKIPFKVDLALHPDLASYLRVHPISKEFKEFIDSITAEVKYATVSYASTLCSRVASLIAYKLRDSGKVMTASETFAEKTGSCRDKANLFMEGCRHMGIPSRFVSGYILGDEEISMLHSWIELYIPGGGWVAFDPTGGALMSGKQVPLTSSSKPTLTLPVNGSYIGKAESKLEYSLRIYKV